MRGESAPNIFVATTWGQARVDRWPGGLVLSDGDLLHYAASAGPRHAGGVGPGWGPMRSFRSEERR